MAGQLTQRWNKHLWSQAAHIVADPLAYARDSAAEPPVGRRQAQRRLSEPTWAKIAAEYESGSTAATLARNHGVDDQTVLNQLRSRGIAIRPQHAAITPDDHQDLLVMKNAGWNNTQIAKHYGCSRQAVQQAVKRAIKNEQAS